jgi:MFS family permease
MDLLGRDGRLLFAARAVRMFGYGFLSVVLVLYLVASGLDGVEVGALLGLTLLGDAAISLWLTTHADVIGRRRVLVVGAALMAGAGVVFASTRSPVLLLVAATIGVISPSGSEVGPFLAVEQAALAQTVPRRRLTHTFAWYNLVGSVATATGALCAGLLAQTLQATGIAELDSYRAIVIGYAAVGVLLVLLFSTVSRGIEVAVPNDQSVSRRLGLHQSQRIVAKLSALFALDAFAGALVIQSLIAFWFHVRFGADPALIGGLLFVANLLSGASALLAARIADRIGLVNTMVFTHLPSNVLLILVPFMPTVESAALVLMARFAISQMDVPTRQSYTQAVVASDERSAAAGITGIARSLGAAASPILAAPLLAVPGMAALPFVVSGSLKIVYDLALWRSFRRVGPLEDDTGTQATAGAPR